MKSKFFDANSYFIDEKIKFFQFENAYQIYNDRGENIGSIRQKLSTGQKVLSMLINKKVLPFFLEIKNANDEVEASISRGWTFFMSKIIIQDPSGNMIGTIQQKFKLFKPTFRIFNASETMIAEISGDWTAWNFEIKDPAGGPIGHITKKFAGAMKEIFTSADKYYVEINSNALKKEDRAALLSCAITIDMVMKESK